MKFFRDYWQITLSVVFGVVGVVSFCYSWATRKKDDLIKDILALIKEGRGLPTWDEHSESKLPHWLDWSEDTLHRKSIFRLFSLRRSIIQYVKIHYEMIEQ